MPGLPGAACTCVTDGSWASAVASACSRPPVPITRVFTGVDPNGLGVDRVCGVHRCGKMTPDMAPQHSSGTHLPPPPGRPDERRVGTEGVRTCSIRVDPSE